MEAIKSFFSPPDPQAQMRKCTALLRTNLRKLDRDIVSLKQVETKTKNLIIAADRRSQRTPQRAPQAQKEMRGFAVELVRIRKQQQRLHTSKAQLSSVQMQVSEAFSMQKVQGHIKASVVVMKEVNQLNKLPELAGTMQELSMELMKAGVIEEMVGEQLPLGEDDLEEDEMAEGEVDKVLGEILKGKMEKVGATPPTEVPVREEEPVKVAEEAEEEDQEAMMDQMRNRLEALRS